MKRRDLLTTAGAAILVVASNSASADNSHMDHSKMDHEHMASGSKPNTKLQDLALACVKTGQACQNHCLDTFSAGDLSMASCARSVDQMLSVCATLAKLASIGSGHLVAMSKVALAVCLECEKECRKHADQHLVCKVCAEACAACADECRKLAS